ncbi:MAG: hypothetical protein IH840_12550, partial [Candidatus Heimdallarchaeota archaeon]|nr:hypothetical protein [Candidatus Heimdallarchaeota archaeon]
MKTKPKINQNGLFTGQNSYKNYLGDFFGILFAVSVSISIIFSLEYPSNFFTIFLMGYFLSIGLGIPFARLIYKKNKTTKIEFWVLCYVSTIGIQLIAGFIFLISQIYFESYIERHLVAEFLISLIIFIYLILQISQIEIRVKRINFSRVKMPSYSLKRPYEISNFSFILPIFLVITLQSDFLIELVNDFKIRD